MLVTFKLTFLGDEECAIEQRLPTNRKIEDGRLVMFHTRIFTKEKSEEQFHNMTNQLESLVEARR